MDGVRLADFTLRAGDGTALRVCLESARWFCNLLRTDTSPELFAGAVARLVECYLAASEASGESAPALLPVREILLLVTRVATAEPCPSQATIRALPARVRDTPPGLFRRLRTGEEARQLGGYDAALQREIQFLVAAPAAGEPAPPAPSEHLYAVHYSCSLLADAPARTPEVSAVVVQHYKTGRRWVFAGFLAAEEAGLTPDEIQRQRPALEAATLGRFYSFVTNHDGVVWLHWNMNEARFGFAALAQRYRVLTRSDPPDIPPGEQFDLSEYLKRRFGDGYIAHPRFHKLIELNDLGGCHYLDPDGAGRSWAAGNYAAVADSTSARVTAICNIYRLLAEARLRIAGDRVVGFATEAAPRAGPADGDEGENGAIYLAGGWHRFGPQQRALLKLVLRPGGVSVDEATRSLALTDGKHLSKLVTELRKSLRTRLRRSGRSLVVTRHGRHLSARWVASAAPATTQDLRG